MPTDDLDPRRDRLLDDRRLLGGIDRAENDAVRLQGDGLRQRRRARRDRTLSIEDAKIPADRLGGFLGAVADAAGAAVLLVGRDIDDQLLALRLRTGGRAGPARDRRRRLGDIVLGHLHIGIVGRLSGNDGQSDDHAAEANRPPADQTKLRHPGTSL